MANSAGNGGSPVIGSVVLASFGAPAVFLATAPAFGVAAGVVSRLRLRPAPRPAPQPRATQTSRPTEPGRPSGTRNADRA